MRINLLALAWLGVGLGTGCGTELEPSRTALGVAGSSDAGAGGADALPPGETPAVAGPAPADGGPGASQANGFPCDVHLVLETYCALCHTGEVYANEFRTPDEWRADLGNGQTLGQYAVVRLRDPMNPMPPRYDGGARPTPAEVDVVAAWVAVGSPDGTCGPLTPPPR
jgi:hypothetical protein